MRHPRALIALLILLIALPARAFELPGLRISHPESGDIQDNPASRRSESFHENTAPAT